MDYGDSEKYRVFHVDYGKALGIDNIKEDRNDGRVSFLFILILDSDCLLYTNMISGRIQDLIK